MQQPLQITFRDIPHSNEVAQHLQDKISQLNNLFNNLISCQVVIEQTQKHQNQGKLHNVRIHLAVPEKHLDTIHNEDENLYKSIQKAIDSMKHQLGAYAGKIRGQTKTHQQRLKGEIARIFIDDDFGFITGVDGNEYYFNSGTVNNGDFYRLQVGNQVHFISLMGSEGLQAHRVCVTH